MSKRLLIVAAAAACAAACAFATGAWAEDPCEEPLRIEIKEIDNQARNGPDNYIGGVPVYEGYNVSVTLKFVNGIPPYSISWDDRVIGSGRCQRIDNPSRYVFTDDKECDEDEALWELCEGCVYSSYLGMYVCPEDCVSSEDLYYAETHNVTWHKKPKGDVKAPSASDIATMRAEAIQDVQDAPQGAQLQVKKPAKFFNMSSATTDTDEITLVGRAVYDGPLPHPPYRTDSQPRFPEKSKLRQPVELLRELPVELLRVRARSSCPVEETIDEGADLLKLMPVKEIRFFIDKT